MPRGEGGARRQPPRRPLPPSDFDDGWSVSPSPRRRSAIHDPWSEPRRFVLPMPPPGVLVGGAVLLVFAFLLGRCTAPGETEVATTVTTAPATTTTTLFTRIHVVQENETLAAIAAMFEVTINDIAAANGITDTNNIFVGQRLKIPPAGSSATTTSTMLKKKKSD